MTLSSFCLVRLQSFVNPRHSQSNPSASISGSVIARRPTRPQKTGHNAIDRSSQGDQRDRGAEHAPQQAIRSGQRQHRHKDRREANRHDIVADQRRRSGHEVQEQWFLPVGFFEEQGVLTVTNPIRDVPFGDFVMLEAKPQPGEFVSAEEEGEKSSKTTNVSSIRDEWRVTSERMRMRDRKERSAVMARSLPAKRAGSRQNRQPV